MLKRIREASPSFKARVAGGLIPRGVFIGIGFHAFHCFLIGYLIFTSTFLPRILGALMVLAGLCWLAFLSPTLTNYLPLQSGLGPARRRFGVPVVPRDGRQRSTMEAAGERLKGDGGTAYLLL